MSEPIIVMDALTKGIMMFVQVIAGSTMFLAIYIAFKQYRLQKTEVMQQNQKLIKQNKQIIAALIKIYKKIK